MPCYSVSKSNVPEVVDYIRRQEEHHHQFNYKQEFLALLRKHGVEYDERYVWD
jgi:putative transposase